MNNRIDKSIKMLGELVAYYYGLGITSLDIDVQNKYSIRIKISGEINNLPSSQLEYINKSLSVPRQHEVEECYWELNGDFHSSSELTLLGMMIDNFEVCYDNNFLTIFIELL